MVRITKVGCPDGQPRILNKIECEINVELHKIFWTLKVKFSQTLLKLILMLSKAAESFLK